MREALEAVGATPQTTIIWEDEFRIGLFGSVRRVWAPRGVKLRQRVQLDRDWSNLVVAVDGRQGHLWWTWTTDLKGPTLQVVLADWHAAGVEVVVWDNAPGHQSRKVREADVPLVPLVPYSPELNPAERIGELIRGHIEGRVYPTIWKKMAAAEEVLMDLAADPVAVQRLCGWQWICEQCDHLPRGSD